MTDSDAPAGASLGSTLGALVITFILVVPVSALLLGFNWTQAVLIGGFASVVAVVSAVVTSRRSDVENSDGDD